jgi:hypothetical protein
MKNLIDFIQESLLGGFDEISSSQDKLLLNPLKLILLSKDSNNFSANINAVKSISDKVDKGSRPAAGEVIFAAEVLNQYKDNLIFTIGEVGKDSYSVTFDKYIVVIKNKGSDIADMVRRYENTNNEFYVLPEASIKDFKKLFKKPSFGLRVIEEYYK